jgi:hypothetical protein
MNRFGKFFLITVTLLTLLFGAMILHAAAANLFI